MRAAVYTAHVHGSCVVVAIDSFDNATPLYRLRVADDIDNNLSHISHIILYIHRALAAIASCRRWTVIG